MKRYFRNFFLALFSCDPYNAEINELREKMEQAEENVKALRDMYFKAANDYAETDKQIKCLQSLVEQQSRSLKEKDLVLARTKKDYQQRIVRYSNVIASLRAELKKTKH